MNYIQGNLRPGENVIIEAKKSPIGLLPSIIWSVVILIIGGILTGAGGGIAFFGIAFLYVLIYMVISVLVYLSAELCVTDKKVIGKTGVIAIKSLDAFLDRIDNISLSQSFWGRLFNYSTISISTVSGRYNFRFISEPLKFKHITMDQMEIFEELRMSKQAEITRDVNNGTYTPPVNKNTYKDNSFGGYSQPFDNSFNGYNSTPQNQGFNSEINVCPNCGAVYDPNSRFCQRCGQPR